MTSGAPTCIANLAFPMSGAWSICCVRMRRSANTRRNVLEPSPVFPACRFFRTDARNTTCPRPSIRLACEPSWRLLAKRYDMVLVDSPPLLSVADTRIMAPLTDAVILVLRSGVTNRESALEAYRENPRGRSDAAGNRSYRL